MSLVLFVVKILTLQIFFFFFLYILCLYATLWVMTDLSVSTYKKLARLVAH